MTTRMLKASQDLNRVFLVLIVGLGITMASPTESLAKPKQPIYNQCACRCVAPGDIVGSISHFNNNAGVSCGAYLGKTCNYTNSQTGGVSTGTLKNCGGYKPGGTQALQQAIPQTKDSIIRRGVEGENSGEAGSGITDSGSSKSK